MSHFHRNSLQFDYRRKRRFIFFALPLISVSLKVVLSLETILTLVSKQKEEKSCDKWASFVMRQAADKIWQILKGKHV